MPKFTIGWQIDGKTEIEAASPEEAQEKFDRFTAEDLVRAGYADLIVGEVEPAPEK